MNIPITLYITVSYNLENRPLFSVEAHDRVDLGAELGI